MQTKHLSACPENPELPGLIGVGTESKGESPGAGSATDTPSLAPRSIAVPAGGLAEKFVLEALGLHRDQVIPLYGDEIGSPRDYGYKWSAIVFTAAGVQRLADHFGIPVRCVEIVNDLQPAPLKDHPRPWWQRDLEEDTP